MTTNDRERDMVDFSSRSVPVPESGCWLWEGTSTRGYGVLHVGGIRHLAHRLSWMQANNLDSLPSRIFICHKCDTPACVNPDHLYAGTAFVNAQDCTRRSRRQRGEMHPSAVLTQKDADYIRDSTFPTKQLARIFEVSPTTIRDVKKRRVWAPRAEDTPSKYHKGVGRTLLDAAHYVASKIGQKKVTLREALAASQRREQSLSEQVMHREQMQALQSHRDAGRIAKLQARLAAAEALIAGVCQQAAWLPMNNGAVIVEMCEKFLSANGEAAG